MEKLQFTDFTLKRMTFEFRYDPAYLLWDRGGQIWAQAKQQWPDIICKTAQPNQTHFSIKDKFELNIELEKSFIIAYRPDLNELVVHHDYFLNLVRKSLEISSYNRLGGRFVFEKIFKNKNAACEAFLSSNMIKFPKGKHFGIDGKVAAPQCVFKWEDDNIGVRGSLQAASRKVEIDMPPEIEGIDPIKVENDLVLLDIDYYTKAPTNPGQFRVADWINQTFHLIKRDSHIFLGEN